MTGWIRGASQDLEKPRVLKVQIPVRQHLELQARRLQRGETLSSAVHAALERYLAVRREARRRPVSDVR